MTDEIPQIKLKKRGSYNERLADLLLQRAKIQRELAAINGGFAAQMRALLEERDRLTAAESEKQAEKDAQ